MTSSNLVRAAGVAAAILFTAAGPALASSITPTFGTFGTLTGATFGGGGIPNDAVAITTFTDGNNTITLGLTAHQRFFNDPVLNDGAGTFTANTGANFGDPTFATTPSTILGATWNFAFYIEIEGGGTIGDYGVQLLYDLDPGVGTDVTELGIIDFNTILGGGLSGFALAEGSENPNFGYLSSGAPGVTPPTFTPFDPFAGGEYSFSLRVSEVGANLLGEAAINVNVVSEPATLALLGLGLAGLGAVRRRRR